MMGFARLAVCCFGVALVGCSSGSPPPTGDASGFEHDLDSTAILGDGTEASLPSDMASHEALNPDMQSTDTVPLADDAAPSDLPQADDGASDVLVAADASLAAFDSAASGDALSVVDSAPLADGTTDGTTDGAVDATVDSTPSGPDSGTQPIQIECSGVVYLCGDGLDNDGDNLIDSQDPECTGPCDNDEASFSTGIPGDNMDACKQDCFFDGNSGGGDDGCNWNLKCDPMSPGANLAKSCPYDSKYKSCPTTQSALCQDFCMAMTPNGCDCFGCCQIFLSPANSITVYLGSGAGCSISTPQNCAACTQVADCTVPCGDCQLCVGKTISDLPAHCFQNPDAGVADAGQVVLDAGAPAVDVGVVDTAPSPPDAAPSDSDSTVDSVVLPADTGLDNGPPAADASVDTVPYMPWYCPFGRPHCLDDSYCVVGGGFCLTGCCAYVN